MWEGSAYIQDDYRLTSRFTLNLGLRYERIGQLGDEGGRNGNFNPALADPNPPDSGSLAGYTVPSNFQGTVPTGVTRTDNILGIPGLGQNAWAPRIGLAWQILPRTVLHSGYGIYYTRPVGAAVFETTTAPPFGMFRLCIATCNMFVSAADPFQPAPPLSDFPLFQSYSPSTNTTILEMGQGFRPPITQQYSLGLQSEVANNLLLEVGYVGARSTKLIRQRGLNQALSASPDHPVRGETTNTVDNIAIRLPYLGFAAGAAGINQIESAGAAWYNALQASLTKRFSHGLQFLASYTWSKVLDTDGMDPEWGSAGGTSSIGDQSANPHTRYGPSNFNRKHRFIISYLYNLPGPKAPSSRQGHILGGWSVSGVTTIQSGQYLTLTGENGSNVFGITSDRLQIATGCNNSQLVTAGSVKSKLANYFNGNCIDRQDPSKPLDVANGTNLPVWPVIGADGMGTGFGNSGVGIVTGPGQNNYDISLQKLVRLHENRNVLFRAEYFNAFNHPQFSNPNVSAGESTFGQIPATSVNPRIIQFALKFNF